MAALHRERLRLYVWIVALSALIGVLYNVASNPWPPPARDLRIGFVDGMLISASVGFIEVFLLNAGRLRWLASLPFIGVVALKTLVYGAIVLAVLTRWGSAAPGGFAIGFSMFVTFAFVLAMQIATLLGFRNARDLLLGRYRAIVFHGDVMNTASRLENATREVGARFIASDEALQALGGPALQKVARCRDLGALALRGRKEPIRASAVEGA